MSLMHLSLGVLLLVMSKYHKYTFDSNRFYSTDEMN